MSYWPWRTGGTQIRTQPADVYLGGAQLTLDDPEPADAIARNVPTQWHKEGDHVRFGVEGSDPGLGVGWITVWTEPHGVTDGSNQQIRTADCTGSAVPGKTCAAVWTQTFDYTVGPRGTDRRFTEGHSRLVYDSADILAKSSVKRDFYVRIDRTAPDLYIEGQLYEERARTLPPNIYDLVLDATDASSGVASLTVLIDGSEVFRRDQACSAEACPMESDDFRRDMTSFQGTHRFEVRATDAAGNVAATAWNVTFGGARASTNRQTAAPPPPSGPGGGCPDSVQNSIVALDNSPPLRVVNGYWTTGSNSTAGETTSYFDDGSYRVSRCGGNGELVVSQKVAQVRTPGGVVPLVVEQTVPAAAAGELSTLISDWMPPSDPEFIGTWAANEAGYRSEVIPPTS